MESKLVKQEPSLMLEARASLDNGKQGDDMLTLRMAKNVYDCHPIALTEDKLNRTLNSANLRAKVELIRQGNDKLKNDLPCIFWQGTFDIRQYAEANRIAIERGENLPSAVNKDKYFTFPTPFCFIDIDQPHEGDELKPFNALVLYRTHCA